MPRIRQKEMDAYVGSRIRELRISRGLSRLGLSKYIGVTHQQIQKYEKGTNSVSICLLSQLSDIFKISTDSILGQQHKPSAIISNRDRLAMEVMRAFAKIKDEKQKEAIAALIRFMVK